MQEGSGSVPIGLSSRLVSLCQWYWQRRTFFFVLLIAGAVLSFVVAWPLVVPKTQHSLSTWWFLVLPGFVLLSIAWMTLCGMVVRLAEPVSWHRLRRIYLEQVARNTELATLKGIPAGLISRHVHLAEIYIPPHFYANYLCADLPVSEQDLKHLPQSVSSGGFVADTEQGVLEAEQSWYRKVTVGNRVKLDAVWRQLIEQGTVVIQGSPGMGKSTLMERLTLYMAARGLGQQDSSMPEGKQLEPVWVPVLLSLRRYAAKLAEKEREKVDFPLQEYLQGEMEKWNLAGLNDWLEQEMTDGRCLVMLDGLDEVADPSRRLRVQEEINAFIRGNENLCYVLITSRVAGYDQEAFSGYPHFILEELSDEDVAAFLPRWCRANLRQENKDSNTVINEGELEQVVEQRVEKLRIALEENQGVCGLARNPLLLTLLLVIQHNSIVLPCQRVELYDIVTKTLLVNREIFKELEPLSELQTIERLGLLAFQMQEENRDFVRQSEVEETLARVLRLQDKGTEEQIYAEVRRFLQRVRERGGLFVSRVGDYFGFMHHTFQEYFAARYILNQIKDDPDYWINELVRRVRDKHALWREPFLLTVAYKSNENEPMASQILHALLVEAGGNSVVEESAAVELAIDAIIESKPLTLGTTVQTKAATCLLACYEQARHQGNSRECEKLEKCLLRWLLSLPEGSYRPPLLDTLELAIKGTQQVVSQRNALILLTLIAQKLEPCTSLVFEVLIPPLLALTGLPAIGPYQPSADVTISADFEIADLALSALSFMGSRGPSGLYLETVRQDFEKHPEQLRLLARCSLECGLLITPTVVPLAQENYQAFRTALEQWTQLQDQVQGRVDENIEACLTIQQSLLKYAEEVGYPSSMHLLQMLQRTSVQNEQPWWEVWQTYLLEQLESGNYIHYQEAALLWSTLFSGQQLQPLADRLREHFAPSNTPRGWYATRFISYFTNDLRYSRDLRELRCLEDLRDLRDSRYIRYRGYLKYLRDLRCIGYINYIRDLGNLEYLRPLRYLRYSEYLGYTKDIIETALSRLRVCEPAEKIDLLTILQGKMLQLQLDQEPGQEIKEEVELLARAALQELKNVDTSEEVHEAIFGLLRIMPVYAAPDTASLWEVLDEVQDEQLKRACAEALHHSQLVDEAASQEKGE